MDRREMLFSAGIIEICVFSILHENVSRPSCRLRVRTITRFRKSVRQPVSNKTLTGYFDNPPPPPFNLPIISQDDRETNFLTVTF